MWTWFRSSIKRLPFVRSALWRLRAGRDINREKISSEKHNNIKLLHEGIAIPPIRFRDMVRRGAILAEDFIIEGKQVYDAVDSAIRSSGGEISETTRVLEFGVGCGRVARHFLAGGIQHFIGSDVDVELIHWCNENLASSSDVRFLTNDYEPPIALASGSIDICYSVSVFTHMTEQNQRAWADELARVIAPGGFLFISFMEKRKEELPSGVQVFERFDQEYNRTWLGKGKVPDSYYDAYTTQEYMIDLFSPSFKLLLYQNRIIRNFQSALVLRRR